MAGVRSPGPAEIPAGPLVLAGVDGGTEVGYRTIVQEEAIDLVIDTSAVLAVLLNEPERPALVQATVGSSLLAPASLPWEIGNALSALMRRGRLTGAQARRVWSGYEEVPIRLVEVSVQRALRIVEQLRIYAYDAYVLEVARQQAAPLVTLDKGLMAAARRMGVEILEIPS